MNRDARKLLLKILAALAACALAYVLLLKPIGWAADWLLGRYGSTPAWSMWFFIGLETFAATFMIRLAGFAAAVIPIAPAYMKMRKRHSPIVFMINGFKALQLKGAGSKPDGKLTIGIEIDFKNEESRLSSLVRAPLLETAIDQVLVILLLRQLGFEMGAQIAASAALFVLFHFITVSVPSGFMSMSGGLYYGFTCAHWMRTSLWKAFWVTAAAHALHNALYELERILLPKLAGKLFGKRKDG